MASVPNEFCAVTGTNGKTTTTELIGAVHRAADMPVAVAGNVGTPVSSYAGELAIDATVVRGLSFQLEDSEAARARGRGVPQLRRGPSRSSHGQSGRHLDAKLRLFENQEPGRRRGAERGGARALVGVSSADRRDGSGSATGR